MSFYNPPARRIISTAGHILPALCSVGLLILLWELYARFSGISPTTLPSPSRVLAQAVVHRHALWENTLPTIRATVLGFSC